MLLSSLLSGLELSETKHASPAPVHVAVLEPVCHKFVAIMAGDQSRFRTYKHVHMRRLAEMFDQCSTDSEKQQFVVDMTNDAITFFSGAATRSSTHACARAKFFPPSTSNLLQNSPPFTRNKCCPLVEFKFLLFVVTFKFVKRYWPVRQRVVLACKTTGTASSALCR